MRKNASRPDAENPEWTAEEIRQARPLMEMLPKQAVEAIRRYRGQRGPQPCPPIHFALPSASSLIWISAR